MNITNIDKIYSDSFGLWISGLFSAIEGNNPGLTFADQKDAFFGILKRWLDEGKVKFCKPSDPLGAVWQGSTDEILMFLQERWPQHAKDEHDIDLNNYFYDLPALLWVGPDGKLFGS
jgi:hypothetical protein